MDPDIKAVDARDVQDNTALHWATYYGYIETVACLLKNGASLLARNNQDKNSLDIALEKNPKMLEPILMKLVNRPFEQDECLRRVSKRLYPNILFLAAKADKPSLFNALVDQILQQPDREAIFRAANKKGVTPLMLAAQVGAHESITKLLDLVPAIVDIEARDVQK